MEMGISTLNEYFGSFAYPGRGIIVGMSADASSIVTAYFIMGRSANSRNRIFYLSDADLYTGAYDLQQVADPSLIIYRALANYKGNLIITNGDQTDSIYNYCQKHEQGVVEAETQEPGLNLFTQALLTRTYEPDAPNFTPRISAFVNLQAANPSYTLSILKKANNLTTNCSYAFFNYQAVAGQGHLIHTYAPMTVACNLAQPEALPSFSGEPRLLSVSQDIETFTQTLWQSLDQENKIALYVRYSKIGSASYAERLVNKYV